MSAWNINPFKKQFRHLNFYSLPASILFVLRKRLNFATLLSLTIAVFYLSIV